MGSDPLLYYHIFSWAALWAITLNHKRISYNISAGFLVVIAILIAAFGMISFGLLGAATYGLFGAGIMAAIFFGAKPALAVVAAALLVFGATGVSVYYGLISYDIDYVEYMRRPAPWLATMTTYLLYIGIAIVGFSKLINTLSRSLNEQKRQTEELQRLNENLQSEVAERELAVRLHKENEEKFRVITTSALDAVMMLDEKGRVMLWNPAAEKIFGYSAEEVMGRQVHSIIAPAKYHDDIRRGFEMFTRSGQGAAIGRVMELTARHKDGHEFAVEIAVSGIQMQGNYWSTAIIRNIEERKKAEEEKNRLQEQLQQAAKMEAVGRLAGGVAHDFNNLLTSISGNIALLLMDEGEKHPHSPILKEVQKAADSAAQLTRQLLSFSRRQIVEPRVIDMNKHVLHMQKMLVRMIGEDVELHIVFGDGVGAVKIDRGQLEQIIMNLVVNARDAMPNGGRISVVTEALNVEQDCLPHDSHALPGRYSVLKVSDTGVGMSEEVISHIFEPFYTTKIDGQGTGLGLATIYGAVQQAGGFVKVSSEPRKGSEFSVFLPQAQEEAEKFDISDKSKEILTGDETILLVEDEKMVRELAVRLLMRWGYNVLQAASGFEAIELVQSYSGNIDMLVTDVVMPGINGRQLAEKLSELRPQMKVLFTSGYTEDVIAHSGVIEKGLNFIGKPYTPAALSQKIREVLDAESIIN